MNTVLFSNNNKPPFDRDYWISKMNESPTLPTLLKLRGWEDDFETTLLPRTLTKELCCGAVWEKALADCMPFTESMPNNQKSKDYVDGTDAKFCMTSPNALYATLGGFENKTGTLRVCVCSHVDNYRLYFLLIPHSVYSLWKKENVKLGFHASSGKPNSSWDKFTPYLTNYFSDVCAKV